MYFVVHDDSFEVFRKARDIARSRGVSVGWHPVEGQGPVRSAPSGAWGSGSSRVRAVAVACLLAAASCTPSTPPPPTGAASRAPALASPAPPSTQIAVAPVAVGKPTLVSLALRGTGVRSLAIAPDASTVAVGTDRGTVDVWDLSSRELRASIEAHATEVRQIAWSRDGRRLFTSAVDVRVWDTATGKPLGSIGRGDRYISKFTVSPDGESLVVWQHEQGIEAWSVSPLARTAVLETASVWVDDLALHPAGKPWVAVSFSGGPVRVLDVRTGREIARLSDAKTRGVWSPDGTRLFYGAGRQVVSWDGSDKLTRWDADRGILSLRRARTGSSWR